MPWRGAFMGDAPGCGSVVGASFKRYNRDGGSMDMEIPNKMH